MIRRSRVVIVICPSLEETVRGDRSAGARSCSSRTPRDSAEEQATPAQAAAVRAELRLVAVDAAGAVHGHVRGLSGARSAVCRDGPRPAERVPTRGCCWPAASRIRWSGQARRRERPASRDVTIFAGERPASEIPAYLLASDVLVSPRSRGTNTPLKIYQYLRSGKAIVATRLLTHTQVLTTTRRF